MEEFCKRLKNAMDINNITQSQLCEKTQIPKSAMSQYLSGNFKPKQYRTELLAKALNVSEAWLMGYDLPKERNAEKQSIDVKLTTHESKVITAYRNHPEMQPAVDTLLGIKKDKSELIEVQVAARSKDGKIKPHTEYITKEENEAEDALLQDADESL